MAPGAVRLPDVGYRRRQRVSTAQFAGPGRHEDPLVRQDRFGDRAGRTGPHRFPASTLRRGRSRRPPSDHHRRRDDIGVHPRDHRDRADGRREEEGIQLVAGPGIGWPLSPCSPVCCPRWDAAEGRDPCGPCPEVRLPHRVSSTRPHRQLVESSGRTATAAGATGARRRRRSRPCRNPL